MNANVQHIYELMLCCNTLPLQYYFIMFVFYIKYDIKTLIMKYTAKKLIFYMLST